MIPAIRCIRVRKIAYEPIPRIYIPHVFRRNHVQMYKKVASDFYSRNVCQSDSNIDFPR